MINLSKLSFDPADAASQAASANVGAWLRAGTDGELLDSTSGALHVSDGGGALTVDATDLDIRDLTFATDSVDVSGSTVTVTATDLDIRDLTFATDSVDVSGSAVTVSATDLDIRDLDAASDSVAAWTHDGTGNAISSSGGALDINIASSDIEIDVQDDKANTAILNTQVDVSVSAALLGAQQAARRFMYIQNLGNKGIYIGASGVTAADGIYMVPGALAELRLGPALSMHAIAEAGTQDIRVMELS